MSSAAKASPRLALQSQYDECFALLNELIVATPQVLTQSVVGKSERESVRSTPTHGSLQQAPVHKTRKRKRVASRASKPLHTELATAIHISCPSTPAKTPFSVVPKCAELAGPPHGPPHANEPASLLSKGDEDVVSLTVCKKKKIIITKKRERVLSHVETPAPAPAPDKAAEQAMDVTLGEPLDSVLMSGLHAALSAEKETQPLVKKKTRRTIVLRKPAAADVPEVSSAVSALRASAAKRLPEGTTSFGEASLSLKGKGKRAVAVNLAPTSTAFGGKTMVSSEMTEMLLSEDGKDDCDLEDAELRAGFQAMLGAGEVERNAASTADGCEVIGDVPADPISDESTSKYLQRNSTFDPCLIADVSSIHKRIMYLMRGPPGCGKSTAARALLEQHLKRQGFAGGIDENSPLCRAFIFSTDDFFTHIDESGCMQYNFDPKALSRNHQQNLQRCAVACQLGITPIIVDNTFSALWEMKGYVYLAESHGYGVRIIDPLTLSKEAFDIDKLMSHCEARCSKTGKFIGRDVLQRMVDRFQVLPDDADKAISAIRAAR
eukprot:TRINITY_DN104851_c0_g1_i1.p1 TRINITY_DN104851_c0_g1~~TRINITY_DN104851_c0_g1_i1.p1  ORF type:complete len:549 (+),score=83.57 TRINITY_DN104851_c0_g1_i1:34-1680(+)